MARVSSSVAVEPGSDPASIAPAARAVIAQVPAWWRLRASAVGLVGDDVEIRRSVGEPPVELPDEGHAPLIAATSWELGAAYAAGLAAADRLAHGRHYTPPVLADALWAELGAVGDSSAGRVFDPACGTGALLSGPLRQAVTATLEQAEDPHHALLRLVARFGGSDLDPLAVWLGNAILAAELLPLWSRIPASDRPALPRLLRVGDGLDLPAGHADMTVLNPPYGRTTLRPGDRERFSDSLYGHANRFALFLHAAVQQTRPGGLIGAVVPTSFLGGAYYRKLRALLAARAPLARLVLVGERSGVFASGVLQETCVAVFARGAQPTTAACSTLQVNGRAHTRSLGAVRPDGADSGLPWLLPRRPGDAHLVARARALSCRLPDLGWKASTGPLVWNRHKPQFRPRAEGTVPVVWGADISDGRVAPHPARDGQRHLRLRDRDRFMVLSEPAVLVQRTTALEQPRRLLAAVLDADTLERIWGGRVVVENHVNVLRCADSDPALDAQTLCDLLNTEVYDRLFRCLSGSVAVSAYELEALPLPDPGVLRDWRGLDGQELEARARKLLCGDAEPPRLPSPPQAALFA